MQDSGSQNLEPLYEAPIHFVTFPRISPAEPCRIPLPTGDCKPPDGPCVPTAGDAAAVRRGRLDRVAHSQKVGAMGLEGIRSPACARSQDPVMDLEYDLDVSAGTRNGRTATGLFNPFPD